MLKPIELPDLHVDAPLTSEMETLLQESDRRIDDFLHHWRGPIIENFVASDYRTVNNVLHWIVEHQLNAGNMFCEWGSGFGVVTLMASLHNFTSFGIEVEAELVDRARSLADDLGLSAEFAQGSFIPPGGQRLIQYHEDVAHIETTPLAPMKNSILRSLTSTSFLLSRGQAKHDSGIICSTTMLRRVRCC